MRGLHGGSTVWGVPADSTCIERKVVGGGGGEGVWPQCVGPVKSHLRSEG